jgi:hypothetical protein
VTWLVGFRTRSILYQPRALYLESHATNADVDGRDKPGHDGTGAFSRSNFVARAYPSAYGSATAATSAGSRSDIGAGGDDGPGNEVTLVARVEMARAYGH